MTEGQFEQFVAEFRAYTDRMSMAMTIVIRELDCMRNWPAEPAGPDKALRNAELTRDAKLMVERLVAAVQSTRDKTPIV